MHNLKQRCTVKIVAPHKCAALKWINGSMRFGGQLLCFSGLSYPIKFALCSLPCSVSVVLLLFVYMAQILLIFLAVYTLFILVTSRCQNLLNCYMSSTNAPRKLSLSPTGGSVEREFFSESCYESFPQVK